MMNTTGSGFNQRLGTARGAPPQTGQRPIGTALREGANPLPTPVSVLNRPLTGAGVGLATGVPKTSAGKDGRVVQDKKYFLVQIKNKNIELATEIKQFQNQIETINKDNTQFITLEKRYEELTKEVRGLEGTLADYNLAVDKQRAGTRPDDIRNMYEHIKHQNDKFKIQLDDLFIERKSQEEQIQAIEAQLQEIHHQAEIKLNELDPDQRSEYENLIQENRTLIQNINAQRNHLEEVNAALSQAEARLRMDHSKQKYIQLKEQTAEFERKKNDLEVQTNENNLSFPEARDRLLAKVKEDNSVIQNTEKRIRDVKKMIENYEKQIREIGNETEESKQSEQDKQKYEILYQRDKEMSEFIDSFESIRTNELNQLREIERNIVTLLEETSRITLQNVDLPTIEQFQEMQSEHSAKNQQLGMAQETLVRVNAEYEQRLSELRNLDTLEENIQRQIKTLKDKLEGMQNEINDKFNNIDNYRNDMERRRRQLFTDRDTLSGSRQKLKDELNTVSYDYELKKQKMSLHEQHNVLGDLEKKISQNEATLYNMKQFIQTKTVDMDYQPLKNDCLTMIQDLNGFLVKNM